MGATAAQKQSTYQYLIEQGYSPERANAEVAKMDTQTEGDFGKAPSAVAAAVPSIATQYLTNKGLDYLTSSGAGSSIGGGYLGEDAMLDQLKGMPDIGTGSFFNTSGAFGPAGMAGMGAGNYLGAAGGIYGMYKAGQAGNKRSGILGGAVSGALAGGSIGGPWGAGIGAVAGGLTGALAHETTADRTKRRYGEIAGASSDAGYQQALQKGQDWSLSGADTWDIGDDPTKAPIEGMKNSYGVLKTFGPEWMGYTPDQQSKIVQGMVDKGLLNSKQGEYLVDDPAAALKIRDSVIGATSTSGGGGSKGPIVPKPKANLPMPSMSDLYQTSGYSTPMASQRGPIGGYGPPDLSLAALYKGTQMYG
jgi:hypothetical protein